MFIQLLKEITVDGKADRVRIGKQKAVVTVGNEQRLLGLAKLKWETTIDGPHASP